MAGVVTLVPLDQPGKLSCEMWKEVAPRRGAQAERRPGHEAGARFLRRGKQPIQLAAAVSDAGKDGHDEDPGADAYLD